jgi:hypothetical protein
MNTVPAFFVPDVDPKDQEASFLLLAKRAHRAPPPLSERVFSITFEHNSEEWTATVGKTLRGVRRERPKRGSSAPPREHHLTDAAKVLAIFPDAPYVVVTNHPSHPGKRSAWENPFFAGAPGSKKLFAKA